MHLKVKNIPKKMTKIKNIKLNKEEIKNKKIQITPRNIKIKVNQFHQEIKII